MMDFQKTVEDYIPRPKYIRVGPFIATIDNVHGVVAVKASHKEFPYQICITYNDTRCVVLDCTSKEEKDEALNKIASELQAI